MHYIYRWKVLLNGKYGKPNGHSSDSLTHLTNIYWSLIIYQALIDHWDRSMKWVYNIGVGGKGHRLVVHWQQNSSMYIIIISTDVNNFT